MVFSLSPCLPFCQDSDQMIRARNGTTEGRRMPDRRMEAAALRRRRPARRVRMTVGSTGKAGHEIQPGVGRLWKQALSCAEQHRRPQFRSAVLRGVAGTCPV